MSQRCLPLCLRLCLPQQLMLLRLRLMLLQLRLITRSPSRLMLRSLLRLLKKKSPPPTKAPKARRLWSPTSQVRKLAVGSSEKAGDVVDAEGEIDPASFFSA